MNRILFGACCGALAFAAAAHAETGDTGHFAISPFTMPSHDAAPGMTHQAVAGFGVSVTVVAEPAKAGNTDERAAQQDKDSVAGN